MLQVERKQQILEFLASQKTVQVSELSDLLRVSLATIRRDLSEMEKEGLIRRVHGGAVPVNGTESEPPIIQRTSKQAKAKRRIGEAAAALVQDGDTILITSGTTTEAMVPFLAGKNNLTVVTNALNIAYSLTRHPHISVIVLGGWLRHSEFSLLGHLTAQGLHDFLPDKTFHGIYGIDLQHGLTGTDVQEAQTDQQLIRAAKKLFILADHSKFSQVGQIRLGSIDAVSVVVTDREAPEDVINALEGHGIQVVLA